MVQEDDVQEADKDGNDQSYLCGNIGAVDEEEDLGQTARKYATRQWRYKKMLSRVYG